MNDNNHLSKIEAVVVQQTKVLSILYCACATVKAECWYNKTTGTQKYSFKRPFTDLNWMTVAKPDLS